MSKLEKEIREAVDIGFNGIKKVSKYKIFQWISKIFLGLCYKELFLPVDRCNPDEGSISQTDQIKKFSMLHFWFQVYSKKKQSEFMPGSVFIFKTELQEKIENNFDLLDNIDFKTISIRLGRIGIIADFLENGIHYESMKDIINKYQKHTYNPLQFRELSAKIFYKASLLNIYTEASFFEHENGSGKIFLFWKAPSKGDALFSKWDQSAYAIIFSHYLKIPLENLFKPPNIVKS